MKRKKRIILLAVFLLIAATWGMRVYWLNQKYPDVERKTYDLQEEVELGKDIIDYDTMEGYFVTIESADIYEYEDLSLFPELCVNVLYQSVYNVCYACHNRLCFLFYL